MKQVKTTLYKKSKTSSVQQWSVFVDGDEVIVEWGQLDGKLQTESYQCFAKNVGRSNQTSAEEQAELEAVAKWQKQIKKNYSEDIHNSDIKKLPAKVNDWKKLKKIPNFPLYASIKYNGVNCLIIRDPVTRSLQFVSRGGEQYPVLDHMVKGIHEYMDSICVDELNVELYKHGEHLQDIQSAVKKHNELSDKLVAMVFELPNLGDLDYSQRVDWLFKAQTSEFVKTSLVDVMRDQEELHKFFDYAISEGYEGIVIKTPTNKYVYGVRASDAWKCKPVEDDEFLINWYKVDKKGHVVFECFTKDQSRTFNVKCKGTDEERKQIAEDVDNWIGKWLKVEYEMLSKDGVPLKPVGICLRDVDKFGNPLQ